MVDLVLRCLCTILEMGLYLVSYLQIFGMKLRVRKIFVPIVFVFVAIVQFFCYYINGYYIYKFIIVTLKTFIIPLIIKDNRKKLIRCMILTLLFYKIFYVLFYIIMSMICNLDCCNEHQKVVISVSVSGICLVIAMIMAVHKKMITKGISVGGIRSYFFQHIHIVIGLICSLLLIGIIGVSFKSPKISREKLWIVMMSTILVNVIFMLSNIWQRIVLKKNAELIEKELQYQYIVKVQKEYFNNVVRQTKDIRKFRHDIRGHIIALKSMAEESGLKEMEEYLMDMDGKMEILGGENFTGDFVVDAVVNNLKMQMVEKNIRFNFEGIVKFRSDLHRYDICTILYNALENAINACEKMPIGQRYIRLSIYNENQQLVYIKILNSCNIKKSMKDIVYLDTDKDDSKNHGIGMRNIRSAVDKYNGLLENSVQEGEFCVEVII